MTQSTEQQRTKFNEEMFNLMEEYIGICFSLAYAKTTTLLQREPTQQEIIYEARSIALLAEEIIRDGEYVDVLRGAFRLHEKRANV